MSFKVVLWDIDGTLLNFELPERIALKKCFKNFGLGECTDEMAKDYREINIKWWDYLEQGLKTKKTILEGRFAEFLEKYGRDPSVAPAFNEAYQGCLGDVVQPYPNAIETVQALRGRVIQAIVTNGTVKTQHSKLKTSGLDKLVDKIFISDEVGWEKPDIRFFDCVLKYFEAYKKDEILIVGDSLTSDMRGGNNAGIRCCWYNPGHKELIPDVAIDYEISDLSEILHLCF